MVAKDGTLYYATEKSFRKPKDKKPGGRKR
jgi:hypothetical protein